MSHAITAILQQQAQKAAVKLKHPRRGVDDQGRSVQFAYWKGNIVWQVICGVFGAAMVLLGLSLLSSGEIGGGIFSTIVGLLFFFLFWVFGRASKMWYYEDDHGFEVVTFYRRKKIAIPYNDIASWTINQQRGLQVKTHGKQKAIVSLPYFRPLILLNTLVSMELEGRLGEYKTEEERNRVIWMLDSEYCEHANKVLEEMEKTGVHVDIPER